MSNEEERLRELAIQIQANSDPQHLKTRILLVNKLLTNLSSSRRWQQKIADLTAKWSGVPDIISIVAEAANNRLLDIATNIHRYDCQYSFLTWACRFLEERLLDLLKRYRRHHDTLPIDDPNANIEGALVDAKSPDELESEVTKLRELVEADPDGHFVNAWIKNHPQANLRSILLLRLDGLGWQEIATKFEINSLTTVSSFFYRKMQNLESYIRKSLCE